MSTVMDSPFDAVVGHRRQRELLQFALHSGRRPHAMLFCGPPGVGKLLVALETVQSYVGDAHLFSPLASASPSVIVLRDLTREFTLSLRQLQRHTRLERLTSTADELLALLQKLNESDFLSQLSIRGQGEASTVSFHFAMKGLIGGTPKRYMSDAAESAIAKLGGKSDDDRKLTALARSLLSLAGTAPYVGSLKIDDVREHVQRPLAYVSNDRPACVIIDDAHKLTEQAENSLLKILEEPPSQCIIILVTHVEYALLPTIRSRCQMLSFGAIEAPALRKVLTEHHHLKGKHLQGAVRVVGGSYRASLQFDEQEFRGFRDTVLATYSQVKSHRFEGIFNLAHSLFPGDEKDRNRRRFKIDQNLHILTTLIRDLSLVADHAPEDALYHPDLVEVYQQFLGSSHARFFGEDLASCAEMERRLAGNLNELLALEALAIKLWQNG